MKIQTIEYRRLVSFGHENQLVGATASIDPGESLEEAWRRLKSWVADRLAEIAVLNQLYTDSQVERSKFESQKRQYERDLAELEARWKKAKAFLEHQGVPTGPHDNLPF